MKKTVVLSAIAILAASACGDVVTERWGASPRCRHTGTVSYLSPPAGGLVARFDLSALPKRARIIRAKLLPHIKKDAVPLARPLLVQALSAPADEGSKPRVAGAPLNLVSPRFVSLDATEVIRQWASGKLANNGLWISGANVDRRRTCLEITYEGKLKDPPPPATDMKAFYRHGQVFLTWKEVNTPFAGKDEVVWGALKVERQRIRDARKPIVTYRIYRHARRITARTLAQAELLDEVAQHSAFDEREIKTEWKGEQIKNVRVEDTRVPRTAVEPKAELPVGTGVFVATCRRDGDFYYAVVSTVDGVENTAVLNEGNTAGPLHEKVAPTRPILFREGHLYYQKKRPHHSYVWWLDPPLWNLPTFLHLSISTSPKPGKAPAPFFVNNYWWSSGWTPVMGCPIEEGVSLAVDQNCMQTRGFHDGYGTYKAWSQGKVQCYFIRQLRALLPWIKRTYNIDEDRIFAFSGGWAWHYPELFAATFECLTMNPKRSPASRECKRYWGDPKNPAPTEWGVSAWEHWNAGHWIRNHPAAELAHISYTPYQHEGDFGWLDKPPFYRAMLDTKHAFATYFHESRGQYGTADASWIFRIRRGDTIAAFGNCTLDDNPGIGAGYDPGGQMNAYLCFDAPSATDEADRWEMTVWLYGGDNRGRGAAPLDQCAVDVTPRRCRKFKAGPGQKFTWTNTSLADLPGRQAGNTVVQTGAAVGDKWGLVTAEKVIVSKGRNRLVIRPAE